MSLLWGEKKKRKPFSTKTKKIEWMLASNRNPYDKFGRLRFAKTSRCRECKRPLTWGGRTYDFDHKDNNPANNSQPNCYWFAKFVTENILWLRREKSRVFLVKP